MPRKRPASVNFRPSAIHGAARQNKVVFEPNSADFHALEQSMKTLGKKLPRSLQRDAVREISKGTEQVMRAVAPFRTQGYPGTGRKPGTLQDGIESNSGKGVFRIKSIAIDPFTIEDYAPLQEYGTSNTPAQPYFNPVLDHLEEELDFRLQEFIDIVIETDKIPNVKKFFGLNAIYLTKQVDRQIRELQDDLRSNSHWAGDGPAWGETSDPGAGDRWLDDIGTGDWDFL